MLASLCLLFALATPKDVAQVVMLSGGPAPSEQTILVVYTDTSMAIGPLESFTPSGMPIPGAQLTAIAPPTSDKLVTKWTDTAGLAHEVTTDCVTLSPQACVLQHQKIVQLMLGAFPAPPPPKAN